MLSSTILKYPYHIYTVKGVRLLLDRIISMFSIALDENSTFALIYSALFCAKTLDIIILA